MFRAVGRLFRAFGYLLTGKLNKAGEALWNDPTVIKAQFERIVREKLSRIQEYMRALGSFVAQNEQKKAEIARHKEDAKQLTRIRDGAVAMAKERARILRAANPNVTKEQIAADPDYMRALGGFNDASSTLKEKEDRIAALEADITENEARIKKHQFQLMELKRDVEKIKTEAAETVAEIITARQEKELNDVLAGVAQGDRTGEELQELRDRRLQARAEAKVSATLAGTDHRAAEAEFLEYARKTGASGEFEALVGLEDAAEKTSAAPASETRVAEGANTGRGATPAGFPE